MLIIKKYTTTPSFLDKLLCGVSSVLGSKTAGQYCNSTFKFQGTAWLVPEKTHCGWVPLATDEGSALTGLCQSFLLSSVGRSCSGGSRASCWASCRIYLLVPGADQASVCVLVIHMFALGTYLLESAAHLKHLVIYCYTLHLVIYCYTFFMFSDAQLSSSI